jgi:ArsR family transcriptional regulator
MKAADINRMFRAFSDPVRLRILHLLGRGELCVGDLVEVLRVPQPTTSRHLRYLRRAGLVEARREGRWSFYSLVEARSGFHRSLLRCLDNCFGEVPELEDDVARAERLRAAGGCCDEVETR